MSKLHLKFFCEGKVTHVVTLCIEMLTFYIYQNIQYAEIVQPDLNIAFIITIYRRRFSHVRYIK